MCQEVPKVLAKISVSTDLDSEKYIPFPDLNLKLI